MSAGSIEGRLLVAAVLVAAMAVWDIVLPWVRQRLLLRRLTSEKDSEPCCEGVQPGPEGPAGVSGDSQGKSTRPAGASPRKDRATADGTEAQKSWRAARELRHQFIPDWQHDESYLQLLHEAAVGGSEEAMDKLSDYAFRRKAFVESFYWKLKLEMKSGRICEFRTKDILIAWVACGCPAQYRNVCRGFSEEQGMFARAVMRLKAGIDVSNANRRLKQLAKEGNADARQYIGRIRRDSR